MIPYYENRKDDFSCRNHSHGNHQLRCSAHLHSHIELVLFVGGRSTAFTDSERVDLQAGDAFIAFPNQIHRYESFEKEYYYIFLINPEILTELSAVFADSLPTTALLRGAADDEEVRSLADRLVELKGDTTPFAQVRRNGYLLALFGKLLPFMKLDKLVPGDSHALRAVVNYCAHNYKKELSLSVLERELHISRYYISHLFSDKLKMSFNDYVNSLRVSSACTYLKDKEKSITEISSLVGFGTLRTFNRAFFRQMGTTPSEYRKKGALADAPPFKKPFSQRYM